MKYNQDELSDILKKFKEQADAAQKDLPQTQGLIPPYQNLPQYPSSPCPSCGHCPHCGRGGYTRPHYSW